MVKTKNKWLFGVAEHVFLKGDIFKVVFHTEENLEHG